MARRIKVTRTSKPKMLVEVGAPGLKRSGGIVVEEFLPQLQGVRANKVYNEMWMNDPVVGAIYQAVTMLMRGSEWRTVPFSQDKKDLDNAMFLEGCLTDMEHPLSAIIDEAITMLPFGFAVMEMVFKQRRGPDNNNPKYVSQYSDNKVGIRKVELRSQDSLASWVFDEETEELVAFIQMAPPKYQSVQIPMSKCLHFVTRKINGNPEGTSILRNAYRPWYFKKRIEEIEAIGIERDLAGFPVMYVDPDIMDPDGSDEKKAVFQEYKDVVKNIRRDALEGLVLPSMYDEGNNQLYRLELLTSGGQRQFETNEVVERYDQRIAMTVLADFVLLGSKSHGSYALSSDKTEMFSVALKAWMDVIKDELNNTLVPTLWKLNGLPLDRMPELQYGDFETPALGDLGNFIQVLANSGAELFPNPALEAHLMRIAGMPSPTTATVSGTRIEDKERREREENKKLEDEAAAQAAAQQVAEDGQ